MTKVLVLGCGPAGLLSAQAAWEAGAKVKIASRRVKSIMPGAQYLHARVPGMKVEPDGYLEYIKIGTAEGYAQKVYGDPSHPVSWNSINAAEGVRHPAWRIGAFYDYLWGEWSAEIMDGEVDATNLASLCRLYDLVISTIPAIALCRNPTHNFHGQKVWILPELVSACPENTIIYSGHPAYSWYRTSMIFGHPSTEWSRMPSGLEPIHGKNFWSGLKPTGTDCDCSPGNLMRVGRFGKWDKNALVHHAHEEVSRAVLAL